MRDDLADLRERYAKDMTERAQRALPTAAEVDDGSAHWYVVVTEAGCDAKAMRWLVRRGFGVFQPTCVRGGIRGYGARADGTHDASAGLEAAFPGYLFVFVWDIEKMFDRIMACPGVDDMLMQFAKPARIPQGFVQQLRELSWIEAFKVDSLAGRRVAHEGQRQGPSAVKRKRKPRKSRRIHSPQQRKATRLLAKEWESAGQLAASDRIALLLRDVMPPVAGPLASGHGG